MTRSCELHVTWLHASEAGAAVFAEATSWLDDAEQARAERFARSEDANHFLLGRWLARRALAASTGTSPACWGFEVGEHGKPLPRGPSGPAPAFNLSHGGGLVVCALCTTPACSVGIDVESAARSLPARRLERFLTERELMALGPASGDGYTRRFWRTWTLKEATLKAAGTGIAGTLSAAEVELDAEAGARVRPGLPLDRIRLLELPITPAHCVSLAVDAPDFDGTPIVSITRTATPHGA